MKERILKRWGEHAARERDALKKERKTGERERERKEESTSSKRSGRRVGREA